jgi:hypothetical protein
MLLLLVGGSISTAARVPPYVMPNIILQHVDQHLRRTAAGIIGISVLSRIARI